MGKYGKSVEGVESGRGRGLCGSEWGWEEWKRGGRRDEEKEEMEEKSYKLVF